MTANKTSSVESQSQSQKSFSEQKKKSRRHLDHLPDLQDALNPFTMVPRCISDLWINGDMPDAKFKLLFCLLSHSRDFKIKAQYLRNRFSPKTIVKYMKELEDEGYIRVEQVLLAGGGYENLHHVNPLKDWKAMREIDDCSLRNSSVGNSSQRNTLNETKNQNETKKNKTNDDDESVRNVDANGIVGDRQKDASSSLEVEAVSFASRMDWLYKKSINGGYSYATANSAAKALIRNLSADYLQEFEDWLWTRRSDLCGRLFVNRKMWDDLERTFGESRQHASACNYPSIPIQS